MSLDECRVCGQRVKDFERGGYEDESAQRGHYVCDGDAATIMGETGIIYVCAACGDPGESEPCREHQPRQYACITGADVEVRGQGQ